jgi:FkbM family methyltransferase
MGLINTFHFILTHPLNESAKWLALRRFARWQISSRFALGPTVVPFVNGTCLVVATGMAGATGMIYAGLHEFSESAFLLHLLRSSDLFVDVGANVGSYTVLASGAIGARTISIEPIPSTYEKLATNIRVNNISDRVTGYNIGLGQTSGVLCFTTNLDTCNHVIKEPRTEASTMNVPVRPLDELLGGTGPALIKIDVEGWESEVLAGAHASLKHQALLGLIVETNSSEEELSPNEKAVHDCLSQHGFSPYAYEPFTRALQPLSSKNRGGSNTIYLRDLESVKSRIASAKPFQVNGRMI